MEKPSSDAARAAAARRAARRAGCWGAAPSEVSIAQSARRGRPNGAAPPAGKKQGCRAWSGFFPRLTCLLGLGLRPSYYLGVRPQALALAIAAAVGLTMTEGPARA